MAVTVYAVYEPQVKAPDVAERADRLAFVKEGFSWPAFLIPLLWLIYHRMWIELVMLLLVYAGLQLAFGTEGQALTAWASLAISVLLGFEAGDLRAASLERRGYRLAGVASGRDRIDAERTFFNVWLPQQETVGRQSVSAPEPRRAAAPRAPRSRGEGEEVIGLFPRP